MKKTILTLSIIISSPTLAVFGVGVENTIEIFSKKNVDDTDSSKIGYKRNFNTECLDYNSKKIIKITNEDTVNNGNDLKSLYEFLVNDDSDKTKNTDPEELYLDHTISVINPPKAKDRNNNPLKAEQQKLLQHAEEIFPKDSANINWEELTRQLKQVWDPYNRKKFCGLSAALLLISKNNNIDQSTQNYLLNLSKKAASIYRQ